MENNDKGLKISVVCIHNRMSEDFLFVYSFIHPNPIYVKIDRECYESATRFMYENVIEFAGGWVL